MSNTWKCRECENTNSVDRAKCICGEPRPSDANPAQPASAYGKCCITGCPMPGGLSAGFGKNAHWYCRWHFRYKDDPRHCQRITEELNTNRPEISGCKPDGTQFNNPAKIDLER